MFFLGTNESIATNKQLIKCYIGNLISNNEQFHRDDAITLPHMAVQNTIIDVFLFCFVVFLNVTKISDFCSIYNVYFLEIKAMAKEMLHNSRSANT